MRRREAASPARIGQGQALNSGSPGPESLLLTSGLQERESSKFKILGWHWALEEQGTVRRPCDQGSEERDEVGGLDGSQLTQGLRRPFPEASVSWRQRAVGTLHNAG